MSRVHYARKYLVSNHRSCLYLSLSFAAGNNQFRSKNVHNSRDHIKVSYMLQYQAYILSLYNVCMYVIIGILHCKFQGSFVGEQKYQDLMQHYLSKRWSWLYSSMWWHCNHNKPSFQFQNLAIHYYKLFETSTFWKVRVTILMIENIITRVFFMTNDVLYQQKFLPHLNMIFVNKQCLRVTYTSRQNICAHSFD